MILFSMNLPTLAEEPKTELPDFVPSVLYWSCIRTDPTKIAPIVSTAFEIENFVVRLDFKAALDMIDNLFCVLESVLINSQELKLLFLELLKQLIDKSTEDILCNNFRLQKVSHILDYRLKRSISGSNMLLHMLGVQESENKYV